MAREIFKNLPDTSTPINASKLNGIFNGEESMGSIVVEDVTCKNIFDGLLELGNIESGKNVVHTDVYRSQNYIKIDANTPYVFSINGVANRIIIYYYDTNKNWIDTHGSGGYADENGVFTTPSDVAYLRFRSYGADKELISTGKIQLEKGTTVSDYIEHKKYGYNSTDSMGKIVVDDISCKNLFDGNFRQGSFRTETDKTRLFTTQHLYLEKDKTYTFSTTLDLTNFTYALSLNTNKYPTTNSNFYESGFVTSNNLTFTPSQSGYFGVTIAKTDRTAELTPNDINSFKYQLEKGKTATDIVGHKEFENKQIYSTNEVKIGTWIDGKPLYRKVYTTNTYSANNKISVSNPGTIVNLTGFVQRSDYTSIWQPIPSRTNNTGFYTQFVNASTSSDGVEVGIEFGTSLQSAINKIIIIIEYTKTIDTATASIEE